MRDSPPRRSWWDTRCSMAGATPAPSAAAARAASGSGRRRCYCRRRRAGAATWPSRCPGRSRTVHQPAPLPGRPARPPLPAGHHDEPVLEDGLADDGQLVLAGHPGPKAKSASRFAISTPSSPAAATPVVTPPPGEPAAERLEQRPGHELGEGRGGDDAQLLGAPARRGRRRAPRRRARRSERRCRAAACRPGSASCRPGSG